MRLKNKLILSYIILITLPLGILGGGYYFTSKNVMLNLARENVLEIVKKNNQIIDERLSKIQNDSLSLMVECELFTIFNTETPPDDLKLLQNDVQITSILNRYFSQSNDIYSVELVTKAYTYGNKSKNTFAPDHFFKSDLYKRSVELKGRIAWVPTYDYSDMYNLPELKHSKLDYQYLFSGVRTLNSSCVENSVIVKLKADMEKPTLVINFKEDLYADVFSNSIPIKGAVFLVAGEGGRIISHQDASKLTTVESAVWLSDLRNKGSGTALVNINGKKLIACFETSAVTHWTSIVMISPGALMGDILKTINFFIIALGVSLLFLSLLFAYWISARITSPVNKLLLAIKRVGGGDFNAKVRVEGKDEFGHLIYKFNTMNEEIKQLINENYIVKLREKETEIMALNIQLNPHFLYNTLNIINWMALYGEKEQVSKMLISLSRMLHYTTDNRKETTVLKDDLSWLNDYMVIMKSRFDEKFTVEIAVPASLMNAIVPKLFLQPIVENAIIYGFRDIEAGGLITIYASKQEEDICFIVEDNGCGIEKERLMTLLQDSSSNIGINNVEKRIKLLYGDTYGVQIESEPGLGTRIKLTLPYRTNR